MDRSRVLAASRAEVRQLAGQQLSEVTPSRRDFAQYVATQKRELVVIARVGATHAPDGQPWSAAQLVAYARQCDDADVAALAVMTGAEGVSIVELAAVADGTTAPILRDDLIIDPSQVYHSRLHGADAVVFPAADLESSALQELVQSVAHLARLGPYPPQVREKLAQEFGRILDLFDTLAQLPPGPGTSRFNESSSVLRTDEARAFEARDAIVNNFPEREGTLLKIPKVIG
jgi:aspartyl/glutamyl-tRNA(Asn/Gln) amidotransferase C subunit